MFINESILDDIGSVKKDTASALANQQSGQKPQLTHRVELVLAKWLSDDCFSEQINAVSKGLVSLKHQIHDAMESMSFVDKHY